MKTIFLDIDGVLVLENIEMPEGDTPPLFNKECVKVLNEILSETNAIIVLSSDWRLMWDIKRLDFIFKFR